jgi:mono/diheme cytochrome c family protein
MADHTTANDTSSNHGHGPSVNDPHASGEAVAPARGVAVAADPKQPVAFVLAEFGTPDALLKAAKQVYEQGYTKFDAHSPFPIHGIDDVMGIRFTRLPWFTLVAGGLGIATATALIYFTNKEWYPFLISGKPLFSIPSAAPVMFELMVLFAAITTLVGMLLLNRLPFFSSPLFQSQRFQRVTNDKFFLSIDARDPKYKSEKTLNFLTGLGADFIETCHKEIATPLPWAFRTAIFLGLLMAFIPVSMVAWKRSTYSRNPRIRVIFDMVSQPKKKTQTTSTLWADGRAMRPWVVGSIAKGELKADDAFYRGLKPGGANQIALTTVSFPQDGTPAPADAQKPADPAAPANQTSPADGSGPKPPTPVAAPPDPLDKLPWIEDFPLPVTSELMARGQERYNIYCATCHGLGGVGNGLITIRAMELGEGTWVQPVTFHSENLRQQPIGRLFHSISNGVRKMPGYGDQIPERDRWAILLYFRALQKSKYAPLSDVPPEKVNQLMDAVP